MLTDLLPTSPTIALRESFTPSELGRRGIGCQVWKQRRTRIVRPEADSTFDASRFSVERIESRVASAFVRENHYSSSFPVDRCSVGLFGAGAALVGVATFSVPMTQTVVTRHCGVAPQHGVELGRLVLLDGEAAPLNSESFFLARAFEVLVQALPEVRAVVSYCDPVARYTTSGECVMPGHYGAVYQACNARHVGRSSSRTLHMLPDGTVLSPRTLSKIRLGERGADAATRRIEGLGAPVRRVGETPAAWIERVLNSRLVRRFRHPGNYAYAFAVGSPAQRREVIKGFPAPNAYPKQRMDSLFASAA